MANLSLDDFEDSTIPFVVQANKTNTILNSPDRFNNGNVIFCKENKGIYIKLNGTIDRYGGEDVINNLVSTSIKNPLSANMGRVLASDVAKKIYYDDIVDNLDTVNDRKPLSATQGNVLKNLINERIKYSDIINDIQLAQNQNTKPISANITYLINDTLNRTIVRVTSLESNVSNLSTILDNAIKYDDIRDNLISGSESDKRKVLSAYQGNQIRINLNNIENILIQKIDKDSIIDHLLDDSEYSNKRVLSAKQGFVLDQKKANKVDVNQLEVDLRQAISDITLNVIDNLLGGSSLKDVLSAAQGKILNEKIDELRQYVDDGHVIYVYNQGPQYYDATLVDIVNSDVYYVSDSIATIINNKGEVIYESDSEVMYV